MNTRKKTPTMPNKPRRRDGARRSRGSVLILVVALLVLMALIGTAWISTARVDRTAAIQNTHNTEVEILVDGVVNMANAAIIADVASAGAVRRGPLYTPSDSTATDTFLSTRAPQFIDEIAPVWDPAPATDPNTGVTAYADAPVYQAGRLVRTATGSSGRYYLCIETHTASASNRPGSSRHWVELGSYNLASKQQSANPIFWAATTNVLPPNTKFEDPLGTVAGHTQRTAMQPVSVVINDRPQPGFRFYHQGLNQWVETLAADTDGDGLADASYFKLPIGRINGLDYYAAIRIIDNNSAANASVASTVPPLALDAVQAYFPSSLNITELLIGRNSGEITLQQVRLNDATLTEDPADDLDRRLDATPDLSHKPVTDMVNSGRQRDDFVYGSLHELTWMVGGRRQRNPGYWGTRPFRMKALPASDAAALAFRGGTLVNPDTMTKIPADFPYYTASSLIEQLLAPSLYFSADNHPVGGDISTVRNDPFYQTDVRMQATYHNPLMGVAAEVFARNTDYLNRWAPEDPADYVTYHNRRTLMTVSNPVSQAVPSRLVPRDVATPVGAQAPGAWSAAVNYDVGDYVTQTIGGENVVFVCVSPVSAGESLPPGTMPVGSTLSLDHPARVVLWEARPFDQVPTKASANAGSFGQLFLGFWQTMAEPATLQRAQTGADPFVPESQTPFKDALRGELLRGVYAPELFDSPYFGNRFVASAYGLVAPTYAPYQTPGVPPATGPDQHPLRMFRSPIRARPLPTDPPFNEETPRLMTDHTMRLRAALAAVNALDMRDSDDNVTVRDINLGVTVNAGPDRASEADDDNVYARARVYGHERQPFLTEVYANTDITSTGPSGEPANAFGYVAIEFYNPYPFPIDLRYCKLATIDRTPTATAAARRTLRVTDSDVNGSFTPHLLNATTNMTGSGETYPWVIPANGFLVLENVNGGGAAPDPDGMNIRPPNGTIAAPASYRPLATGLLPSVGLIAAETGTITRNYAYVPNLHTVLDKEVVLLRPLSAQVGETLINGDEVQALIYTEPTAATSAAVDMAPLDSFDFTGLPNPDPAIVADIGDNLGTISAATSPTQAFAWHYARAFQPTTMADTTKAWRFVYPGRYDAHQTIDMVGGVPRPRQQGTQEAAPLGATTAGWDTGTGEDPWDPMGATPNPPNPGITLAVGATGLSILNASYYPYEYAIPLINTDVNGPTALLAGAVGPNPVVSDTGNAYPFGGFARNGDILQVPYIGSYRVKLTPYGFPPAALTTNPAGVTTQFGAASGVAAYHQVLELNSISMDSAFAEDSDPSNHYNPAVTTPVTDPLYLPPENIGRFTPTTPDLEFAAAGTVDAASTPSTAVPKPVVAGTMEDPLRQEAGAYWNDYEIVITDGPGKGQVRPVLGFSKGVFTVFPNWEVQLANGASRYILRRGPMWRDRASPYTRTSGNKFWAADLFDFVGIETPQTDFLPAADPISYARFSGMLPPQAVSTADSTAAPAITYARMEGSTGPTIQGSNNLLDRLGFYNGGLLEFVTGPATGQVRRITGYDPGSRRIRINANLSPGPVTGDMFRIFGKTTEETVGTEGLVNINTAPWPVLARLPFGLGAAANQTMAQAIVLYRDGDPSAGIAPHGPFRSIFDLYKVPWFAAYQRDIIATGNPEDAQGDRIFDVPPQDPPTTPPVAGSVRYDFEEQYLLLNRISNLITTRSDSFTVYVLVQGWRGAGTANPELVVQRRRAFIADRTGVAPRNKDVAVQFLYND